MINDDDDGESLLLSQLNAIDAQLTTHLSRAQLNSFQRTHARRVRVRVRVARDEHAKQFCLRLERTDDDDDNDRDEDSDRGVGAVLSRVRVAANGVVVVDWSNNDNASDASQADVLEVRRALSNSSSVVNVELWPMRVESALFVCSSPLAQFLGRAESEPLTRGDVLLAFHAYVQCAALADSHSQVIRCDRHLKAVFKLDSVPLEQLGECIDAHLKPAPPALVSLPLARSGDAVVTLAVELASTPNETPRAHQGEQQQIDELLKHSAACEKRRQFYLDFHKRPLAVLNELVSSMAHDRDLRDIGVLEPGDDTIAAMFRTGATDAAIDAYMMTHESARRVVVLPDNQRQ